MLPPIICIRSINTCHIFAPELIRRAVRRCPYTRPRRRHVDDRAMYYITNPVSNNVTRTEPNRTPGSISIYSHTWRCPVNTHKISHFQHVYKIKSEAGIKKSIVLVKQNISVRLSVTTPPLFACLINLAIDGRIHVLLTA